MALALRLAHLLTLIVIAGCARHAPARADKETSSGVTPAAARPAPQTPRHAPFALVELFTSQGCSSCPPADRHLAEIDANARTRDLKVYTLSFHVDYWNHLGWRDPFSDPAYSERQAHYGRQFTSGRVYTPQMVINGREEFVGSDRSQGRAALARALEQRAAVALELTPRLQGQRLDVAYRMEGDTRGATLHLAVTQPVNGVRVERGENAGETLAHSAVVRAFVSYPLSGALSGTKSFELPAAVEPGRATLVGYIADPQNLAIRGASSVPLDG
jgi:hypothetical protein